MPCLAGHLVGDSKMVDQGKEMARKVDSLIRSMNLNRRPGGVLLNMAHAGPSRSALAQAPASMLRHGPIRSLRPAGQRVSTSSEASPATLCCDEMLVAASPDCTTLGDCQACVAGWQPDPDFTRLFYEYINTVFSLPPCGPNVPGWKRCVSSTATQSDSHLLLQQRYSAPRLRQSCLLTTFCGSCMMRSPLR